MYNKLFTKILDSTIWLEDMPTRIVWLTFIAAMDEDGFCQFAAIGNVASRARVSDEQAEHAIASLEGPDTRSGDQEFEGRRIERVPGGWMVLNAKKYRDLVTSAVAREKTRERVRKHREKKTVTHHVTLSNAPLRNANVQVTQSETETETYAETEESQNQDQNKPPLKNARRDFSTGFPQTQGQEPRAARKGDSPWTKIVP